MSSYNKIVSDYDKVKFRANINTYSNGVWAFGFSLIYIPEGQEIALYIRLFKFGISIGVCSGELV